MERHDVRNTAGLRWLVQRLLGNAGSEFSGDNFHKALKSQGISIGKDTVHRLLSHLEDCFLVRLVWMESYSERQLMSNPRKAYPAESGTDPGVRSHRTGGRATRWRQRSWWSWSAVGGTYT